MMRLFHGINSKYSQIDRYLAPSALGRGWDNGIVVVYSRYIGVYVFHVFFISTRYLLPTFRLHTVAETAISRLRRSAGVGMVLKFDNSDRAFGAILRLLFEP